MVVVVVVFVVVVTVVTVVVVAVVVVTVTVVAVLDVVAFVLLPSAVTLLEVAFAAAVRAGALVVVAAGRNKRDESSRVKRRCWGQRRLTCRDRDRADRDRDRDSD